MNKMSLYLQLLLIICLFLLSCKYSIWPSIFDKSEIGQWEIGKGLLRNLDKFSLTALYCFLHWKLKIGDFLSFYLSGYVLVLVTHLCYRFAERKIKQEGLKVDLVYDVSGYIKYILVSGGIWALSVLIYVIVNNWYGFLSWEVSVFATYSLLPWYALVHELYPSNKLQRSKTMSRILWVATIVDIIFPFCMNIGRI